MKHMTPEAFTWWSNLIIFTGVMIAVVYFLVSDFLYKRHLKEKFSKCSVCDGIGLVSFEFSAAPPSPCAICKGTGKLDMEKEQ